MQDLQQHPLGRYRQPSLAGMLAQQHQDDIARTAEQRRMLASALARNYPTGVAEARTFAALRTRLTAVRAAIARVLRPRPVTSNTSTTVACCT